MDAVGRYPRRPVNYSRKPSVGLRRSTSSQNLAASYNRDTYAQNGISATDTDPSARRRSTSDPQRSNVPSIPDIVLQRAATRPTTMPSVAEDAGAQNNVSVNLQPGTAQSGPNSLSPAVEGGAMPMDSKPTERPGMVSRASSYARNAFGLGPSVPAGGRRRRAASNASGPEYDADIVNYLDVVGTFLSMTFER